MKLHQTNESVEEAMFVACCHDHMLHRTGLLTEAQVRGSKATKVAYWVAGRGTGPR